MENIDTENSLYAANVIEFATVAVETCILLENASSFSKVEFVESSIKILPLLYMKTLQLDVTTYADADSFIERFVTEQDYLRVKTEVEALLGADDSFLEVFHPDMPYSDTPIAVFMSENLADIYQELKDFAANFQHGVDEVMRSALLVAVESFAEHWGQKLLNVLRAMHAVRYADDFGHDNDNTESENYAKLDRNSFLSFLSDDE